MNIMRQIERLQSEGGKVFQRAWMNRELQETIDKNFSGMIKELMMKEPVVYRIHNPGKSRLTVTRGTYYKQKHVASAMLFYKEVMQNADDYLDQEIHVIRERCRASLNQQIEQSMAFLVDNMDHLGMFQKFVETYRVNVVNNILSIKRVSGEF